MNSDSACRPRIPWIELAVTFVASRLLIGLVGFLGYYGLAKGKHFIPVSRWLDALAQWDGAWYLSIAETGYSYHAEGYSSVAFFPLYPLLIYVLNLLLNDRILAGVIVSNLALFGACVVLWKLVADLPESEATPTQLARQQSEATMAVRFLLFGPVSLFFSAVYSESTFLFFCLASLWCARMQRWPLAGLCGCCAALTRNVGVLLIVPLLIEYVLLRCRPSGCQRETPKFGAIWALLPIAGSLFFMSYLQVRFGDAFIWMRAQQAWGRKLNWPWIPFCADHFAGLPFFYRMWFMGAVVLAVALMVWAIRERVRFSHWVFGVLLIIVSLSGSHLEAIPRYLSVVFPLYIVLAKLIHRAPLMEPFATAFIFGMLSLSTILFFNGYWFT